MTLIHFEEITHLFHITCSTHNHNFQWHSTSPSLATFIQSVALHLCLRHRDQVYSRSQLSTGHFGARMMFSHPTFTFEMAL